MAHLHSFRQGWNHERFAQFILGKVSFISTPDTIGDDTGFDVSGFFIKPHPTKPGQILPFLPYVIQVKPPSWGDANYIAKHLRELAVIGIPYYIGVVRPDTNEIDIYSGKGLQALFSLHDWEDLARMVEGRRATVRNELAENYNGIPAQRYGNDFTVVFYKVATLSMTTGYDSNETLDWIADCQDSLNTMLSAKAGEFIFHGPPDQYTQWIGIGTFTHALRRFMHAACMIAEEVNRENRFVTPDVENDRELLIQLRNSAQLLDSLRCRHRDRALMETIIDSRAWRAWIGNVVAIGERAERRANSSDSS